MTSKISNIADPEARTAALRDVVGSLQTLGGLAEIDARLGTNERADPSKSDEQRAQWTQLHEKVLAAREQERQLQGRRWDAAARSQLETAGRGRPVGGRA